MRKTTHAVRWLGALCLVALVSACDELAPAGEATEIALGEREAVGGACLGVAALRELGDGSLLLGDEHLGLLHLRGPADEGQVLGRSGSGPGEYDLVAGLYPLRGDTTLLFDRAGRVLSLAGTTFLGSAQPVEGAPGGGDIEGNLLLLQRLTGEEKPGRNGTTVSPDSVILSLVPRNGGPTDTIGRFAAGATGVSRNGRIAMMWVNHLAPFEPSILFPDGWFAVVRPDPYRVDWRSPEGDWRRGEPIPAEVREASERELLASVERYYRYGAGTSQWDARRLYDMLARNLDFPGTIPVVTQVSQSGSEMSSYFTRVLATAPDGRLLVRRSQPADSLWVRYDVVDRRGRLNGFLRLQEREEVAGSGARSLYIVQTEESGCQRLSRVAWTQD